MVTLNIKGKYLKAAELFSVKDKKDIRHYLKGVRIQRLSGEKSAQVVATNTYSMYFQRVALDDESEEFSFTIPSDLLKNIKAGMVAIEYEDGLVTLAQEGCRVTAKDADGNNSPKNFMQVVPDEITTVPCVFSLEEVQRVIKARKILECVDPDKATLVQNGPSKPAVCEVENENIIMVVMSTTYEVPEEYKLPDWVKNG